MSTVLVVDNDAAARGRVNAFLTQNGFVVRESRSLDTMSRDLRLHTPDVVITDPNVAKHDNVLSAIRGVDQHVPIVLLLRTATLEQARQAVRQGADHLLTKPVDLQALLIVVQRLVEMQQARRQANAAPPDHRKRVTDPFLGTSRAIQQLAEQAHRIVHSHAPILVQGETGTGKGVLAAWLHHDGPRSDEAFVDINCAGLSRELLESELFGYERGAFTGATGSKQGLFDVAHGGTIFLDEIGEIDLNLQPRLLKVLEDKRFRRLGDVKDRVVDVRLIAATNRDLAERSKDGSFRADLYYRINTITLTVPSLRERREDIPLLARGLLAATAADVELTPDAIEALVAYDWPGNVRELRNVLDRAVLVTNHASRITRKDLQLERRPPPLAPRADDVFEPLTLDEAEHRHIERTIEFVGGSVVRAAALLGISRSALYKKLKAFRPGD